MTALRRADKQEARAVQQASGSARALAESMPRLILEARRIAATVIHGLHGRRRAGPGENFWQYRRFFSGEPARHVDWRRSARDDNLYVREREWEAAHTVWIWPDRSPSMLFRSPLARESKLDRALVMTFALAEILVQAGERVGVPNLMPSTFAPTSLAEIVLVSDFWSSTAAVRTTISQLASNGSHGHAVQIVDPAEETFPYSGRVEFIEPEGAGSITAGRAEAWKSEYESAVAGHRAAIRAEADRLGWSFSVHRTDRAPTELLLALHARLGTPPAGAMMESRAPMQARLARTA